MAQAILKKAAEVTNIEAQGAQPFLLVAKTSWTQYGKTTDGQFAQAWQAPDRFRQETTLPGFIEAVVAAGNVFYRTRNADFIPLAAIRPIVLSEVSAELVHLQMNHLRIESPPSTPPADPNLQCILAVTEFNQASIQHVICVDRATGVPLSEENKFSSGGMSRITFADYSSVGEKQVPRDIKYEDSDGVRGEFQVVKLNTVVNFPDSTFQRPAQSIEQPWCADPQVIDPPLRSQALDNWRKWTPGPMVMLNDPLVFVAVNGKGDVQNSVLLDDSNNADQQTAARRVRRGKFPVKKCGNQSIPYEIVITLARMEPYE